MPKNSKLDDAAFNKKAPDYANPKDETARRGDLKKKMVKRKRTYLSQGRQDQIDELEK